MDYWSVKQVELHLRDNGYPTDGLNELWEELSESVRYSALGQDGKHQVQLPNRNPNDREVVTYEKAMEIIRDRANEDQLMLDGKFNLFPFPFLGRFFRCWI